MMCNGCFHQSHEEGMGAVGAALEFGVELDTDKKRVVPELHGFDQHIVRRDTADDQALLLKLVAVSIIEFITMTVAFADVLGFV